MPYSISLCETHIRVYLIVKERRTETIRVTFLERGGIYSATHAERNENTQRNVTPSHGNT